jgi:hypothetical protein
MAAAKTLTNSNKRTPTISTTSGEAHGWQHYIGRNWHNRAPASEGEYTIPPEDGRVAGAHGWQHHIGRNWHNRAPASGGEYTITPEDGRVRPKHVEE